MHHARRMTRCCNISSLGQMALESTICGIVHHARRTRAHCPTMVSSFKLSSGTVCLLGFSCRAGHIRKGKYKICSSYQCSLALGRNHKSYIYPFLYDINNKTNKNKIKISKFQNRINPVIFFFNLKLKKSNLKICLSFKFCDVFTVFANTNCQS